MPYPKRTAQRAAAMLVLGGVIGAGQANAAPQRPTLDPGQVCNLHTIVSGDTLSKIAKRNGITLDDFIRRNTHVTNPNLIWPGDVVVINCEQRTVAPPTTVAPTTTVASPPPAPAPTAPPAEVQRVVKPAPSVDWPGANPFLPGEQVADGVASQGLILRTLHVAGARGNQLIGLAAITECESNRRLNAEGDQHLADRTWDASVTPWQIRSQHQQRGKGTARDIDALRDDPLGHGAAAAIEVYNAALAAGRDPLRPWTCYLNGHHRSFLAPYTSLAEQMDLLS